MSENKFEYLNELNQAQRNAVEQTEGPVMIIAGAGSGKTRVITYRIAHLINKGVEPSQILALTFTNKAAKEMQERIGHIVNPNKARRIWMGTFHSIFSRILRMECEKIKYPPSFTIYDTEDSKNLIKSICKEFQLNEDNYKPNILYNRISNAKNNLISSKAYAANANLIKEDINNGRPLMSQVYSTYARRCFTSGAMDFDDLLFKTYELFVKHPDVLEKYRDRFRYILVDEYQDTNFSQYAIIKLLAEKFKNICVVGDDAQSIYAFRGADISNILNFEKDYPNLKIYKLEQNYRSTQNIVQLANGLIAGNKKRLKKNVWTDNARGEKIKIYKSLSDNEEARLVAQNIHFESQTNQVSHKDFAILYRTNAQSRVLEEALRKYNIPYRIFGGTSFYQRKEIKDLIAYFRMCVNPNDEEAIKRVINYPARGIGDTTMGKLVEFANKYQTSIWSVICNLEKIENHGIRSGTYSSLKQFQFLVEKFIAKKNVSNAYETTTYIATESGILKELYLDKTPEGVSRYENIQELLNAVKDFVEKPLEEDEEPATLERFLQEVSLLTDGDNDKGENEKERVTLMTIHSAKGLEFPMVYIVGLEEKLFPSQMSINSTDDIEEERRLFYVAITRAMKKLTLSYSQTRYRWGNLTHCEPSRFLAELDPQYIETTEILSSGQYRSENAENTIFSTSQKTNYNYTPPPQYKLKKVQSTKDLGGTITEITDIDKLKKGVKVLHSKFGKGVIEEIEGIEPNLMANINFAGIGEKKLLLKFAKLQVLE